MKKLLVLFLLALMGPLSWAQDPYTALGAKLDEYFVALAGESAAVQNAECDFLISSCKDSLVRQFVTLKIYDHYVHSKIMGDDAVAVHVAEQWLIPGKVKMHSEMDLLNAQVFAAFNRHSLIGAKAPLVYLKDPSGREVRLPASKAEGYSLLYFHDTGCSTCRVETARLKAFLAEGKFPLTTYAIYTGTDEAVWKAYREDFPGVVHLWDPGVDSDYQRKYGVLQTPKLFLLDADGTILGRGLDTPALSMLLHRLTDAAGYEYGGEAQMDLYRETFAVYGDTLRPSHVLDVAEYVAGRTIADGDISAYRQMEGDLLYYLSSQRGEAYKEGTASFVDRFIDVPDIWESPEDTLRVLSLAHMLKDLSLRTPVGSQIPDLTLHGTLRYHPGLFCKGTREGDFALRKLKGAPGYVVFYSPGCGLCQETLSAVDRLVSGSRRVRVLLVDMDALEEPVRTRLLDTFDLSALPFVLELDRKGTIVHRYVQL